MSTFQNIHSRVALVATKWPDLVAINDEGKVLTYRDLNTMANRVAHGLIENGGAKSGCVGVCLERSSDLMVAILGILKAGAAYVPFDVEYPATRLNYMAGLSNISVMITSPKLGEKLPTGSFKKIDIDDLKQTGKVTDPDTKVSGENPAYVLFTSGSTGEPKGVQMPHRALCNLIDWQLGESAIGEKGRTLQFAPVSFDVHFQEIFSTWWAGGELHLIHDELRLNARSLLTFIEEHRINRLFLPFIALQNLCELARSASDLRLDSLKEVITAGEQLQVTPAVISFFERLKGCTLFNHYGPTETHVVTAYRLEGPPSTWPPLPSIGKPIQHSDVLLLDEQGKAVVDGQEGELYATGLCLADGYLHRDELTAERFLPHAFKAGERMYRTGDLARRMPDGNLQYLGRIDGQVKVRGFRIELGEVEHAVALFSGVREAAATVREDRPGEKRLIVYVTMDGQQPVNIKELRTFLQRLLPDYMMPSAFVRMDGLPRTPSGKIDRRALPAPGTARPETGIPYKAPVSTLEEQICRIWSELLEIEPIGTSDNFFDFGGNSILATRFTAQMKAEHGHEFSVIKIYQYPTAAALAAALGKEETEDEVKSDMENRASTRFAHRDNEEADPIAVVGMAVRMPGAEDLDTFWNNLREGKESITFFCPEELDPSLPSDLINDPNYVPARGVLKDAAGFDASFFNMNPNLARVADPQQRILLELAWNALEHAGHSPSRYNGLIGVFAGTGNNTYYLNNVLPSREAVDKVGSFMAMTLNEKDYIATRIAYELNLRGLAVSVHTACSTSLTAIAQACNALWNRECDMVLAGGVSVTSPVNSGQRYEEGAMYSNDGHTRTFDSGARGTVFSDGAGMVVLKRYSDALADGDTVYALVRGTGLNNDGGDKGSFTAPSIQGQAGVISMAQAMAGTDAGSISYIEAHGTATPLGDPIEIEGLTTAFRRHTDKKQFCAIGSVKTNFGHLTAAAGVAGFIKTVLSLYHKELPPSLHYKEPNPQIPFEETPFYVNSELRPWDTDLLPRRAGISSFGVGGTNAHVVLEEAPQAVASGLGRTRQLLMLSAKTATALAQRKKDLREHVLNNPGLNIADAAFTLQTGRHDFVHRWFAVVDDNGDACTQLDQADVKRSATNNMQHSASGVAFMFPGQGSQYTGMGSTIYRDEPVFREAVDRCVAILQPLLGRDLKELLFAPEGNPEAEQLLKQTFYTQPALFTIGYSLAQLWMSWGVRPSALIGHSIGEFVAATIAGVFSLEEALTLVAGRSRLMQDCPGGAMLSVRLAENKIQLREDGQVAIAAVNGPQLCVVAGPYEEVSRLQQQWESEGIICKPLHTSHAFHSPMMDPVVEPFLELVKKVRLSAPSIPILSTVTTEWLTDEQATDPLYWAGHLRATVRFAGGVRSLWTARPGHVLLELGPRNTATTLARQQAIDPKTQKAVPSLGDSATGESEWATLLSAMGQLWLNGITPDWNAFYAMESRRRIPLPVYPFEHLSYWIDASATTPSAAHVSKSNGLSQDNIFKLPQQTLVVMPTRKERLIREISAILEEASGMDFSNADVHAGFIEQGLDSLFLTQVALTISKKYGIKVSFRQLNDELSSLENLSSYLDSQLPAEVMAPAPASVAQTVTTPPAGSFAPSIQPVQATGDTGNLQWLITQQLQIMQQQLMALSGQVPAPAPPSIPAQPADMVTVTPVRNDSATPAASPDEEKELKKPFGAVARIEKSSSGQFNETQQRWLTEFTAAYTAKTKKSKAYTQQHRPHLADPRVVTGFRPHLKEMIYQPVVNRSLGSRIWDIDGNEYVDILNGFGSNMFGHNPPFIVKAIAKQLQKGYELGPQHELAGEVAEMICEFTGFERAGLCNTGSEAVLGAMRIARTVTGRPLIVSFNGAYHGINDEVIVRGTKKHKPIPAAAGIMPESVHNMLVLDYGTPEALEIIRQRADEIAAVMVEPVQSRRADFQPREFLHELRKITNDTGSLLIFDEVITGFRIMPGGAQQYFDVKADLGTYGKVVGGGMPIGVIAGRREYMDTLDGGFWQYGDDSVPETGVTYFAGTFVRHPFALAAAKASLLHMKEKGAALQESINGGTAWLAGQINEHAARLGVPLHIVHFGSLFKPKYDAELPNADLIYLLLRHKGVHLYDGFPCFLTEAHTREDIAFIAEKFRETLEELVKHGFLPGQHLRNEYFESTKNTVNGNHVNGNHVNGNHVNGKHVNGKHVNGNHVNGTSLNGKSRPSAFDPQQPPVEGALPGKNPDGSPGWFIPDPNRPGKFLRVKENR